MNKKNRAIFGPAVALYQVYFDRIKEAYINLLLFSLMIFPPLNRQ
jgi:hypothetical protein